MSFFVSVILAFSATASLQETFFDKKLPSGWLIKGHYPQITVNSEGDPVQLEGTFTCSAISKPQYYNGNSEHLQIFVTAYSDNGIQLTLKNSAWNLGFDVFKKLVPMMIDSQEFTETFAIGPVAQIDLDGFEEKPILREAFISGKELILKLGGDGESKYSLLGSAKAMDSLNECIDEGRSTIKKKESIQRFVKGTEDGKIVGRPENRKIGDRPRF